MRPLRLPLPHCGLLPPSLPPSFPPSPSHPSLPPSLPQWYTSRLGPGSGSTPSLTSCQGRDMVVITDGELRMNLIYLDAETGGEGGWEGGREGERRKKEG